MGSSSSPPQPPDPRETSQAQSAANRDSAISSSLLNMVNERGPFGSVSYNPIGQYVLPDSLDENYAGGGQFVYRSFAPQSASGGGGGSSGGGGMFGLGHSPQIHSTFNGVDYVRNPEWAIEGQPRSRANDGLIEAPFWTEGRGSSAMTPPMVDNPNWGENPSPFNQGLIPLGEYQARYGGGVGGGVGGGGGTMSTDGGTTYYGGPVPAGHYALPHMERVTQLSPQEQAIYDEQARFRYNILDFANQQLPRVNDIISTPTDTLLEGLPQRYFFNTPEFDEALAATRPGELNRTVGPMDYEDARSDVEEALYSRINPQLDRDRDALRQRLASQGILPGTEAFNREIEMQNQAANDARMMAVLAGGEEQSRLAGLDFTRFGLENAATQQTQDMANTYLGNLFNLRGATNSERERALNEAIAMRQLPITEMAMLLGTGQTGPTANVPQGEPRANFGIAAPDFEGNTYRGYEGQLRAWEAQQAQRSQTMGNIFGMGSSLIGGLFGLSDRRFKEAIRKVGDLANGLGVYFFRYIGDTAERIGVMADEVAQVRPSAVHDIDGVAVVDYGSI